MKQIGPILAYHEPGSLLLDNPVLTVGVYGPENLDEFRAFIIKILRIRAIEQAKEDSMTDAIAMQKYTLIQPVVMEGFPDAHNVFLQVTNQRFRVSQQVCHTKEEAEWLRDQLCVALAKIVGDSKP